MGIVLVASLAARIAVAPADNDDVHLETHQLGRVLGIRSSFPSRDRHSMTMFFPSMYPRSRRPMPKCLGRGRRGRNGATPSKISYPRDFLRLLRLGCHSKSKQLPLQQRLMSTAAFFIAHLVSSVMYHADRDKGKCDLQRKATGISRVERPESA